MSELSETFKRLEQDPQGGSQHLLQLLEQFLQPFLLRLDDVLDKRVVRTLLQCLVAIIRLRNNPQALWISELGSYLQGYDGYACSATAGTKRVGKLLRSVKWTVGLIDHYLLEKADEEVRTLKEQCKRILCIWDGSVLEKAESEKLEGLCPVLSSKAKRRQRTKRGFVFNWPAARPVRVMGMQWNAALIVGMQGLPHLAVTKWWSTKGVFATRLRDAEEEGLRICVRKWGSLLVHVFDRGYASGYWLRVLAKYRARFIIRWVKHHVFLTLAGEEKKLWQIGQGKKYRAHKEIWDGRTGEKMACDLWWTALRHPQTHEPLFLVKARVKKGIMYLITNEPVHTEEQAWDVFFSYRRRWQIEVSFRYAKCELALECPRLWSLEARLKLLGMVMLVYAFLLSLLDPRHHELVQALLRFRCHRTGKRCLHVQAPLYRIRWALSRLWNDDRPRFGCFLPPSDDPLTVCSLIRDLERFQKNWG
ncbi:hypothetical protein KDA_30200 [Dictyobacter alpinus]|uniref:Transposase IS4-like domain-containing protein n=1 Tax=Dictyobacter alpinus TaxID=2014873 RepID=A0A402B871_9CHLR|nr:hypothetical protein [Dictyobacter alpinus]GCE27536.1 hypothetical protein KDA_30200 [Dictyobacter alpinus]